MEIEGFFRTRVFIHEFSALLLQLVFRWGDADTFLHATHRFMMEIGLTNRFIEKVLDSNYKYVYAVNAGAQ